MFSIQDVDYAILEPNGDLSVLKKPQFDGVTRQDLNIASPVRLYLPIELIVDGRLVEKNLTEKNLTKEWLLQELNKVGYLSYDEVFFAELQSDGTLFIEGNNPH